MNFIPKKSQAYQQFAEQIRRQIEEGLIGPGERLLPEGELARHYQLGLRLVRKGLTQLQKMGYLERRPGRGTVVLQRKTRAPAKNGRKVAIVFQGRVRDPMTAELFDSLQQPLQKRGLGVTFYTADARPEAEAAIVRQLIDEGVDGTLLFSCYPADQYEHLAAARKAGMKLVLLDHFFPGFECDVVRVDDEAGGYLAATHLLRLGRTGLLFITRENDWTSCRLRKQGVQTAIAEFGSDARLGIIDLPCQDPASVKALLPDALSRPIQGLKGRLGIVGVNDQTALAAMECLLQLGWEVPRDAAVVGFNDELEGAISQIPLTTVEIPVGSIGRMAAQLLWERMEGDPSPPQDIRVPPRLIIRDSCGCYPIPVARIPSAKPRASIAAVSSLNDTSNKERDGFTLDYPLSP